MPTSVFISHSHEEKELALAWKQLIDETSQGAVESWLSSDQTPGGGMPLGKEWRDAIYEKIATATHVFAIVSPQSLTRPWILWECGVATGVQRDRLLVPIVHSMSLTDLPSPLQSYQSYDGDQRASVIEVCRRLITGAGLKPNPDYWKGQLDVFENRVRTSRPKRAISPSLLELWVQRFERLIASHRGSELPHYVDQFYLSAGERRPLDSRIHDQLSEALLAAKRAKEALQEVDFGLSLSPDDTILLHRKGLILMELQNYAAVEQLLGEVYERVPQLKTWPELAGLEGRMYRERASASGDPTLYAKAAAAYRRAFEFDPTQHYPGGQAVVMALLGDDQATIDALLSAVVRSCEGAASSPKGSYWEDFTLAEMYLVQGDLNAAVAAYARGFARDPEPDMRDRESALKGARRTAGKRQLAIAAIEAAFTARGQS
jgi:tetratricopeptide (TPR) repeat protein